MAKKGSKGSTGSKKGKGGSTGSKGSIRTGTTPGTTAVPKGHQHGGYGM
jgi:hypothetical protein